MSKFCNQCGAAMEDDALFCMNCGAAARVTPAEPAPVAAPEAAPAAKKPGLLDKLKANPKKTALFGGIAVALIAVIVVLCIVLASNTNAGKTDESAYEAAVKNYIKVMTGEGNEKAIKNLAPKEFWEVIETDKDVTIDDIMDIYDDFKEDWEDNLEYMEEHLGSNVKLTYKITDADKMDEDDLKELKNELNQFFDIKKKTVTAAYELEITLILKGDDDKQESEDEVIVVQIDGAWYLWNNNTFIGADDLVDQVVWDREWY
jgi:hypothetical protein